jgi:hypothetical protein
MAQVYWHEAFQAPSTAVLRFGLGPQTQNALLVSSSCSQATHMVANLTDLLKIHAAIGHEK